MTEPSSSLPAETITSLIRTALQAYQRGEHDSARALVRALAARQPDDLRVWLTLAKIAETRDEQRRALERVIAIDPQHPLAQSSLARFEELSRRSVAAAPPAPARAAPPPARAAPPERAPRAPETDPQIRWPLYVVLGVSVLIVLIAYALLRPPAPAGGQPTPALPGAAVNGPASASATPPLLSPGAGLSDGSAPPENAGVPPALTEDAGEPTLPAPTAVPASATPTPMPTATVPTVPTAATQLPTGQLASDGEWTTSLLRPDYAIALDGSIGALQPQGRFVLALMSVANTGATASPMPPGLLTLVDGQGRSYRALPSASTAYLDTFGRGQRGDFSMEDAIPPGGRTWSVPVIFDVPPTARALTLQVGNSSSGWPVTLPEPAPAPAPTPGA